MCFYQFTVPLISTSAEAESVFSYTHSSGLYVATPSFKAKLLSVKLTFHINSQPGNVPSMFVILNI